MIHANAVIHRSSGNSEGCRPLLGRKRLDKFLLYKPRKTLSLWRTKRQTREEHVGPSTNIFAKFTQGSQLYTEEKNTKNITQSTKISISVIKQHTTSYCNMNRFSSGEHVAGSDNQRFFFRRRPPDRATGKILHKP